MSASKPQIKVEELVTITVTVPKDQKEAVLAAITAVTETSSSEPEPQSPQLSIVPNGQMPRAAVSAVGRPESRPATPADLARLRTLSGVRHNPSSSSDGPTRVVPTPLADKAPDKESRTEFHLGFVSGTPTELKALADKVVAEMPWLIELAPNADDVRKSLAAVSDKETSNPNHWALVTLSGLQKDLHWQENYRRRQTVTAPKPAERQLQKPRNNGWTAARRQLTQEEQDRAEAQSAAALEAKKVMIGRPNQQGTVVSRGTQVPGVGGGGSKKVRQARRGSKKS